MGTSLYQYTNDFLEVKAALENAGLDPNDFSDALESYEDDITSKMENIIKYHDELIAVSAIQQAESKRFEEASKANVKKAERLKDYMDQTMKAIGASEIQAGAYKLTYQKGREIVVVDEDKLPTEYWTTVSTKKAMTKPELKKLIDAGKEIEGVCLKRNPDTLQIKM